MLPLKNSMWELFKPSLRINQYVNLTSQFQKKLEIQKMEAIRQTAESGRTQRSDGF
jgi:hypothetical protein